MSADTISQVAIVILGRLRTALKRLLHSHQWEYTRFPVIGICRECKTCHRGEREIVFGWDDPYANQWTVYQEGKL